MFLDIWVKKRSLAMKALKSKDRDLQSLWKKGEKGM